MKRFALWDAREHQRLLEARAHTVAATLRRVRRAVAGSVAGWWSDGARALIATLPARTVEAQLVALTDELDDLVTLQRAWDAHLGGDEQRLSELVDWFVQSEHVRKLMPRGRLPRDPAPSVRRLLKAMQDDLEARLVIQWAIDAPRAPVAAGAMRLSPTFSPSWGHSQDALLLGRGRAVIEGPAALPSRFRFAWDARGYRITATELRLRGAWGGAWEIRAPGRTVRVPPSVGPWRLLPPVVDEDGGPRRRRRPLAARARADRERHLERIERARQVLAAAWPAGARTVDDFTRAILPVTQREVVSYSFQPVPGWSYLNLYHRDFVDLVDDLVHENAHHHLNHILSDGALWRPGDDDNLIYYSPWRETLRPLGGILHSVFTFHAGAELFRRLWRALSDGRALPHRFTAGERRKIAARCLEETAQVRYSLPDLAHAFRQGRLTARGHALARAIAVESRGFDRLAPSLRRAISGTRWARRLATLEATLADRDALRRRRR